MSDKETSESLSQHSRQINKLFADIDRIYKRLDYANIPAVPIISHKTLVFEGRPFRVDYDDGDVIILKKANL